jgi:competence protein ComEC
MTPSKILLYFCLAFVGGIFLSSLIKISQLAMLGFLIFGIFLISVLWKYKKIAITGFCVLFLVLGVWRHQEGRAQIANNDLKIYNDKEAVTLIGFISREPAVGQKSTKLTISSEKIILNGQEIGTNGDFLVMTGKYPLFKYGQEVELTGKLITPSADINNFNYKDYLSKDGIYSVINWPKIQLTGGNRGNIIYSSLFSFKNKLKSGVDSVMSPPQSVLLEALFFGDEGNFTDEWKSKFTITGTRHITAVSGMNITIIAALIINLLILMGLWRGQAFYISVVLIILYILMIGAPASAVRAGIMGLIFLTAQHLGRAGSASRAVVFASALMLAVNPLLLRIDVGFQLSFLAVMGLIYLQPFILELLKKIKITEFFQLRYTLAATLSAQIFTLPILIYNFGSFSLISTVVNILIVPTLSLITILGFLFSFITIIFQPLGQLISWPAWLLLSYITGTIDFFSKIPFALLKFGNISWIWLGLFYFLLLIFLRRLKERQKLKFLQY